MKKKLTNNLGFKIISVFLAIMLWLVVLNVSDPEKTTTIINIPITILNEEAVTGQGKVYEVVAGKTASVKVTGPRTIIDSLEASSFRATADLADLSMTNAVDVEVELVTASYRSKVDIDVQTTMRIAVEDLVQMEFNAEVAEKGRLPEGYVVFDKSMDDTVVNVTAPKSVMDTIAKVAATVDISNRNDDFSTQAKFQAFDNRGNIIDAKEKNITFDISGTTVHMVVYSVKQIPLIFEIKEDDYPDTVISSVTIDKEKVTIAGREEALAQIGELNLDTSTLEISPEQSIYELSYDLQQLLPEGVYVYGSDRNATITVETDAIVTRTFTIPANEIAIKSLAAGFSASHETTGDIEYILRGRKSFLDAFEPNENPLFVSTKNLAEGEYVLEVQMDLEDGITLINPVYVKVKIMKKEDEPTTSSQGISVPGSDTTSGQNESSDESTTTGNETTGETETTSESSEQSEGE